MNELPFIEKVGMLSINPDAATRDDVAEMAAQLMENESKILKLEAQLGIAKEALEKIKYETRMEYGVIHRMGGENCHIKMFNKLCQEALEKLRSGEEG